jgi:hypothetical protein
LVEQATIEEAAINRVKILRTISDDFMSCEFNDYTKTKNSLQKQAVQNVNLPFSILAFVAML